VTRLHGDEILKYLPLDLGCGWVFVDIHAFCPQILLAYNLFC
jgi:hypothetical protein